MAKTDILPEPQFATDPGGALPPPPPHPLDPQYVKMKMRGVSQPEDAHVPTKTLQRDLPLLFDGDFLQVTSDELSKTVNFRWARKHYPIAPGGRGFVPFEALVNQLGDPRSQDNAVTKYSDGESDQGRGIVMDRNAELTRLFAMYGVQNERLDDGMNLRTNEMEPGLTTLAPKVRVETLSGQRVWFPAQQPFMLPFPVQNIDPTGVSSDTTRMIDAVASENADMREQLARMEERLDQMTREREGIAEQTTGP